MKPASTDDTTKKRRKPAWRRWLRRLAALFLLVYLAVALYHVYKPLPDGVRFASPLRAVGNAAFLSDLTWTDVLGTRHVEQRIFDEVLRLIGQARQQIVLDMFLFNDFAGAATEAHRPLSNQLTRALIERKRAVPELKVLLITDPFNTLYGGVESRHFTALRDAGITVVETDLARLRASNPAWSGFWRLCCRWAGNDTDGGWLPNPVGPGKVTLRSYLSLLNFSANHRKTLVVDSGDTWTGLVMSANPHDASSAHGNVALRFEGPAAIDLLRSEQAVAAFSNDDALFDIPQMSPSAPASGRERAQVLTEGRILEALTEALGSAGTGDRVDIDVFYFSHRRLLQAVVNAHTRGAAIRVLLDPNEDAFGRKKNGVPNRQVGRELHEAGISVRWCDTHGEQCHSKFMMKIGANGHAELIVGSANFTRRNLDDYNLETSVRVIAPADAPVMQEASRYFAQRWNNTAGRRFSRPYADYADDSLIRYAWYRFGEATGLSTY